MPVLLFKFQRTCPVVIAFVGASILAGISLNSQEKFELRGRVLDEASGKPIYSRIYLEDSQGKRYHVQPAEEEGKVVPYRVERSKDVHEVHTTVSDHIFRAMLGPGKYKLTAEHGKEYLSQTVEFELSDHAVQKTLKLKRWSNLASRKWYSGEVHLHRRLNEVPIVALAEDLNVSLPLTYWVTDTDASPVSGNKTEESPKPELIHVSPEHVIWPVNTEYEIFSVKRKQHTLGAFFVLGHQNPLQLKTPPVLPVVQEARAQHALIDLDKHNWPWSMMLIPQMKVDLFELTNNHIWRTKFLFKDWYKEYAAGYMNLNLDEKGNFTPKGWLNFGFANYYALLNCGFRISPSGGTASGVHPVPAGFGRVYVHLPEGFSYKAWMDGLKKGRSFVTNGPTLEATINQQFPGHEFDLKKNETYRLSMTARYPTKGKVEFEFVVNGKTIQPETVRLGKDHNDVLVLTAEADLQLEETSWVCVRCQQELPNGNISFAHSAPFYFRNGEQPIKPRKVEVEYLIKRVSDEIERNRELLDSNQLAEFENALKFYREKLKEAVK